MKKEEYEDAAQYWINKDQKNIKMDGKKLLEEIEKYINANNTCALATGCDEFIRCTPIEYSYFDNSFWMFSEGGLKFKGLENNDNVCLAIYDKYTGFGKLKGMQVTGTATIIVPFSDEYIKAAQVKKISIDALKKLPNVMHLICVKPTDIDFLNSDFKDQGFTSRQHYDFR